ncbi:MAG TPA: hypothetical protein VK735_39780 [Pseudonocardia sp.]|uniref:hypothetical protein n=1 Tax=Pseudonocardia sp. TaxID=60912 RepID=UPI002C541A8D|nr:hypothetical protein [Pseudonocardia sp.]HTF53624.1 hypothetical protein [Pseudonocardia sp.]
MTAIFENVDSRIKVHIPFECPRCAESVRYGQTCAEDFSVTLAPCGHKFFAPPFKL